MQADHNYALEFILVLPFVAAFFYVYFRIKYPWLFWRTPPRPRPLAPEKCRRPGWLARLRARTGAGHRRDRWAIGYANPIFATSVKIDDLRHHALLCGATGSGKTSALELLIDTFAGWLPVIVLDCKASGGLQDRVSATRDHLIWRIGGSLRWDPLRGDPTSVANRLIQGEWYSRDADVYRAAAERYVLWLIQAIDQACLERTPQRALDLLDPNKLLSLLRDLRTPEAVRLSSQVHALGQVEREGVAGFRARFGLVVEGITGQSLGPGVALEHAIQSGQTVLFSVDAATYPALATKIGAWVLLDLVRVAAQRSVTCLVIVDEFSALGREGRHVIPLLARTREAGMMCVVATQGLADLARVEASLPQQITQNTAVRLAFRQGSAEDQEGWSALLGGAPVPFSDSRFVDRNRARAVSPDELATLRTGEAFLQIMPTGHDTVRKRLWIARPRKVGAYFTPPPMPETEVHPRTEIPWASLAQTEWRLAMVTQSNQRRLPNWRITERDLAIVGEVLRWRQLTTNQIARWFFTSSRTASNRIAVLSQMGYLKTIDIPWRASALVTATPKGARARADLGLRPRASEPGRLLHDLTVVQIAAWMLDQDLQAAWITERQLLRDELTAARDQDGRLRRGPGRRPDGVLVRANRRQEAVEVELTPKRDRTEYDCKLGWYLGQVHYQRVHWFASSSSLRERLRRVAREMHMDDFVTVAPLPTGLDYPPGIKADRQASMQRPLAGQS